MSIHNQSGSKPKLLDQIRIAAIAKYGRPEPGERFAGWVLRFVLYHGKRHPAELYQKEGGGKGDADI